ncbi:hypothetical protein BT96DRAFT_925685 [Gymnopus androsaceus JB14]|uniref:Uncharacterized protein n=1 Tax=Gymnopus androsaceus JB14 TaxID=1447944 RepID=A0A6A4GY02_9AGAR|nr:hypothetical protein BT96DRAFT_925685 [Gymnopus androsaceus JB14]
MENASDGGHEEVLAQEKILCTTDLGLLRAEKVQGEERTWHNTILLKPKIVMSSSLTASPTEIDPPAWKTEQGEESQS